MAKKLETRRSATPSPLSTKVWRSPDDAFVRGYVAAVAEFSRRQIKPRDALSAANITRYVAVASGVLPFDLEALEGQWATFKPMGRKRASP